MTVHFRFPLIHSFTHSLKQSEPRKGRKDQPKQWEQTLIPGSTVLKWCSKTAMNATPVTMATPRNCRRRPSHWEATMAEGEDKSVHWTRSCLIILKWCATDVSFSLGNKSKAEICTWHKWRYSQQMFSLQSYNLEEQIIWNDHLPINTLCMGAMVTLHQFPVIYCSNNFAWISWCLAANSASFTYDACET